MVRKPPFPFPLPLPFPLPRPHAPHSMMVPQRVTMTLSPGPTQAGEVQAG